MVMHLPFFPIAGNPCTVMRRVIISSKHHSSVISWNIFIQFEAIVNETLFLLLVYLLSGIHMFRVVKLVSVLPSQNNIVGVSM